MKESGMLIGNSSVSRVLNEVVAEGKESHAYLFCGPEMVGKTTFAIDFARKLLCSNKTKPCEVCANCLLTKNLNHPDLFVFDSQESVGVEEIRDLIGFLELKPYQATKKVAIVTNIERMSVSAMNSFLKTLEEPKKDTIIVLTAINSQNVLQTIVSRCQNIRFNLAKESEVAFLLDSFDISDHDRELVLGLSAGRPGCAIRLAKEQDKIEYIYSKVEEFDNVYFSKDYYKKIKFAEAILKKKEEISDFLAAIEICYRAKLLQESSHRLKIIELLDKLSEIRLLLIKNINTQLVFESLLFEGKND